MQKKRWAESVLHLTILLSLFRVDWESYFSNNLRQYPELNELILGQNLAYTQTQFHNIYNDIEGISIHPKSINTEQFHESIFRELQTLHRHDFESADHDITALLLDRPEFRLGNANYNNDQNNNDDETSGESDTNNGGDHNHHHHHEDNMDSLLFDFLWPGSELTSEDMALIDILWKQDIDMGVCREIYDGTYRQKELEKEKQLEIERIKVKKENDLDEWSGMEYSIDGETGEYFLIPPQNEAASEPQTAPTDPGLDPEAIDYNLDECIQMLREHARQQNGPDMVDDEGLPLTVDIPLPTGEDDATAEQQWEDLASLSELQLDLPSPSLLQQPLNDTYAVNATTNGNVNLQNATIPVDVNNLTDFSSVTPLLSPVLPSPSTNYSYNTTNTDSILAALLSGTMIGDIDMMDLGIDEGLDTSLDDVEPINAALDGNTGEPTESTELTTLQHSYNNDDKDSAVSVNSGSARSEINSPYSFDSEWNETASMTSNSDDGIYDGIEGASAMDYNDTNDNDMNAYFAGKQALKEESQYEKYQHLSTQPPNMDNIKHNHTYPQPSGSDQKQNNKKGSQDTPGYSGSSSSRKDKKSHKLSRDERRAKGLKVPFSCDKIINLPVDDFNELLSKYSLSEAQLTLIRDIRRRGKNKVAAQHCRKRKIDSISSLSDEMMQLKAEKERLCKERRTIDKETTMMKDRFQVLYREVFESLRDESGEPYDPEEFSLQQSTDGNVFLVPNTATRRRKEDKRKNNRRK